MTKMIKKPAALLLALAMAVTFVTVLGSRQVFADSNFNIIDYCQGTRGGRAVIGQTLSFNPETIIFSNNEMMAAYMEFGGPVVFSYDDDPEGESFRQNIPIDADGICRLTLTNNIGDAGESFRICFRIGNGSDATKFFTSESIYTVAAMDDVPVTGFAAKTYTGKPLTQNLGKIELGETILNEGIDYQIEYQDNVNAGTATVILHGMGNFDGTSIYHFQITPASVSGASLTGITEKTYTGKAVTQTPVVKIGSAVLTEGKDYTVTYENNIKVGTAVVTITGTGNYAGSVSQSFKITGAVPNSGENSDKTAADTVSASIAALKSADALTLADKDAVAAARAAYNKLTDTQKKLVSADTLKKLTDAEAKITALKKAAAKAAKAVVKGKTYTVSKMKYKVTNANMNGRGTVTLTGTTKSKRKLTRLTVPKTVKINGAVFKVTAIGNKAFGKFTKIRTVTIGDNVRMIGTGAFAGNKKLTKVTIGRGAAKIGGSAFLGDENLKTIVVKSTKLKSVGKKAIRGICMDAVIRVPKKQLKKYRKLFSPKTGFKKTMTVHK